MSRLMDSIGRWLSSDLANNLITLLVVICVIGFMRLLWVSPVWGEPLHRLSRNLLAMVCLGILALYGGVAVLDSIRWTSAGAVESQTILDRAFSGVPQERQYSAPLATHEIGERNPRKLKALHLLGTNGLGQDVLKMTLKGSRTAWIVGGFTLVLSIPVAIVLGISAGYFGKWVDDAIQYLYITLSSIPGILLLISLMMALGKGLLQICIALAITNWVGLCRLLRGETLKHREKEYVMAARALGVHPIRIILRHILPNVLFLVIISATLSFSDLVLTEAVLDYLNIGVGANTGSWGVMIAGAQMELTRTPVVWWNLTCASTALFFLVLAANLFGDGVRDAFDPRLRRG